MTSNLEIEGARRAEVSQQTGGLSMDRKLTAAGSDPLEDADYVLRDSQITNSDGSVVFELKGAQVPEGWSQLATDIAVSKYFRKAGIDGDKNKGERSVRQLVYRVAHSLREPRTPSRPSSPTSSSIKRQRSTPRFGSTVASTSGTASKGRAATTPGTPSRTSSSRPTPRTSIHSAPPASSRPSMTTSWRSMS